MPEDAKIKITADASEYVKALKEAEREIRVATALQEELARVSQEYGRMGQDLIRGLNKALREQWLELADIRGRLRDLIQEAEKYKRTGEAVEGITDKFEELKDTLEAVEKRMREIEKTTEEAGERAGRFTAIVSRGFTSLVGLLGGGALMYTILNLGLGMEMAETEMRRITGFGTALLRAGRTRAIVSQLGEYLGMTYAETLTALRPVAQMVGGGLGALTPRWLMALWGARGVTPEVWGGFFQRLIAMGGAGLAGEAGDRQRATMIGEIWATALMTKADRRLPMFLGALERAVSEPIGDFLLREEEVHGAVIGMTRLIGGLANLMPGFAPEQVARIASGVVRVFTHPTTPFGEMLTYRIIQQAIREGAFREMPFITGMGTYAEVQMARARIPGLLGAERPEAYRMLGGLFMPFIRMARAGALPGQTATLVLSSLLGVDPYAAGELLRGILAQYRPGMTQEELGRLVSTLNKKLSERKPKTLEDLMDDMKKISSKVYEELAKLKDIGAAIGHLAVPVLAMLYGILPTAMKWLMRITGTPPHEVAEMLPPEVWSMPGVAEVLGRAGIRKLTRVQQKAVEEIGRMAQEVTLATLLSLPPEQRTRLTREEGRHLAELQRYLERIAQGEQLRPFRHRIAGTEKWIVVEPEYMGEEVKVTMRILVGKKGEREESRATIEIPSGVNQ